MAHAVLFGKRNEHAQRDRVGQHVGRERRGHVLRQIEVAAAVFDVRRLQQRVELGFVQHGFEMDVFQRLEVHFDLVFALLPLQFGHAREFRDFRGVERGDGRPQDVVTRRCGGVIVCWCVTGSSRGAFGFGFGCCGCGYGGLRRDAGRNVTRARAAVLLFVQLQGDEALEFLENLFFGEPIRHEAMVFLFARASA